MPVEYHLVHPNTQLRVEQTRNFRAPQVPIDGLGRAHVWGQLGMLEDHAKGFAIVRNQLVKLTTAEFENEGFYPTNILFFGLDTRGTGKLFITFNHQGSNLRGSTIANLAHAQDDIPNEQYDAYIDSWSLGEDPTSLYWFSKPNTQDLSQYSFTFQRTENLRTP